MDDVTATGPDTIATANDSAAPSDTGSHANHDASTVDATRDVAEVNDAATSGGDASGPAIGPNGGTVDQLHFAVFGDVRPSLPDIAPYPSMVFTQVMDGVESLNAQFAVGTGDYMFANFCATCPGDQLHRR